MARRQFSWTDNQLDKLNKVIETLKELSDYKPLTLRQVYYQLVGKGYIENNKSQYGMLSQLLKWARIEGWIAWTDIEDRVRVFDDYTGYENYQEYINRSLKTFLEYYRRNLLQTQEKYIEVWIEKDALSSVFSKVLSPLTVSLTVCRGFSSVSFLNDYKIRLSSYPDKNPVILYFGDFDPSGMEMLESMKTTFETEMNINNIEFKRIALTKDDIINYKSITAS